MMEGQYHIPVLLDESVSEMNIHAGGVYVDVTFGGGGHSREILSRIDALTDNNAAGNKRKSTKKADTQARLYSFDQDADAIANAEALAAEFNSDGHHPFTFVRSNFRYLKNFMLYHGEENGVDAILADLGVSSHHFDDESRGFSFRYPDAPLDMRMNRQARLTAADILNTYTQDRLADIFYLYGELRQSRQIASSILKYRANATIATIGELINILQPFFPRDREKKEMAKAFQALRIEVNHEMEALTDMLRAATEVLKPGGRLVVITYHSLEDRLVKNLMKTGNTEGHESKDFYGQVSSPFTVVTRKPILPTDEEQLVNPRSRSAKLRVAEKK